MQWIRRSNSNHCSIVRRYPFHCREYICNDAAVTIRSLILFRLSMDVRCCSNINDVCLRDRVGLLRSCQRYTFYHARSYHSLNVVHAIVIPSRFILPKRHLFVGAVFFERPITFQAFSCDSDSVKRISRIWIARCNGRRYS